MATRLTGTVVEQRTGDVYKVRLDQNNPGGDGLAIDVIDLSIKHKAASDEPDEPFLLSTCKVKFWVDPVLHESVFSAMQGDPETQWKLRVTKNDALHWVGFVLLDLVEIEDTAGRYRYDIEATDGIARLKTFEYREGDVISDEYETLYSQIQSVLVNVPLDPYYSAGEEYIRINATLWPEGATPTTTANQLELTRCSYRAFRLVDRRGNPVFSSSYEVLGEILRAYGLRMMYSQGRYVLADITDYSRASGAIEWVRRDINGNPVANDTLTDWTDWETEVTKNEILAGGKITFLPAVRSVKWVYKHYSKQNILPEGSTWDEGNSTSVAVPNFRTAPGLQIRFRASVRATIEPPFGEEFDTQGVFVELQLTLRINTDGTDYELVRNGRVSNNGVVIYDEMTWEAGLSGQTVDFLLPANPRYSEEASHVIEIVTPEVPEDGEITASFSVTRVIAVRQDALAWLGATYTFRVFDAFMETTILGSVEDQYNYSIFDSDNTAYSGNSELVEREVRLGDGPTENSFGRIEYFDGANWKVADGWRHWLNGSYVEPSSVTHGALMASDVLALRDRRRQELNDTFVTQYAVEYPLLRTQKRFIPTDVTHDIKRGRWRGKWIEIEYVPASASTPVEQPSDTNPVFGGIEQAPPLPPPPPVGNPGDIWSSGGLTNPGSNTVPTTTGLGLTPGVEVEVVDIVDTSTDVPLYAGDTLTITHPVTGELETVTVAYDSALGVPGEMTDPGAQPFYEADGTITWLVPGNGTVAIEAIIPTVALPANSYVQVDPQYQQRLQVELRKVFVPIQVFGFTESLTVGFTDGFWTAQGMEGYHFTNVHFAMGVNSGPITPKINLKYYDATGFRYTVATYENSALRGTVSSSATAADGYYRVEVESMTAGTAPTGLTLTLELVKIVS
jgi:hypothetical protein